MQDKDIKIADAALASFLKFGIRRTTMNDIASAAGITRQTLYNSFDNKDAVLQHAVRYYCQQQIERARQHCVSAQTLERKLQICFEHFVLESWHMLREFPESEELENGAFQSVQPVLDDAARDKKDFIAQLILVYQQDRNMSDVSAEQISAVLVAAMVGIKSSAQSEDELNDMCRTLIQMAKVQLQA